MGDRQDAEKGESRMTSEEVIEVIKAYRDKLTHSVSNQIDGDIEAFDMAIKALEQEPKIGHWDSRTCKCSECGYQIAFSEYAERKYKYCSNCGVRMVEQERSDKE